MRDVLWLNHSDEVSGTTVMKDVTKVHWTEGRSSRMAIIDTGGARIWRGVDEINNPYMMDPSEGVEIRNMTEAEEAEWSVARNCLASEWQG